MDMVIKISLLRYVQCNIIIKNTDVNTDIKFTFKSYSVDFNLSFTSSKIIDVFNCFLSYIIVLLYLYIFIK